MKTSIKEPVSPTIVVYTDEVPPPPSDIDEISTGADRHPSLLRRLRPLVQPLVFVALAGALFAATELPRGTDPSGSATAEQAIQRPASEQPTLSDTPMQHAPVVTPRFIAPATARPGEQITVVGYRDSTLCGASELRFDDVVAVHQIHTTAASKDSSWIEVFMTMDIPSTATPGVHHIQLHGPVPGGAGGPVCGGAPEHQDQLAGTDILIVR